MASLTPEEKNQVYWLLGPFLVGGFLDIFLQGILCTQFFTYHLLYKDDKRILRIMVLILAVGTTLKTAQMILSVWEQSIVYFGDVTGAVNISYTKWWQTGSSLMTASIGIFVQSFFLWRLWSISKSVLVLLPIASILLFAYIAIVMATYYISKELNGQISLWFAAHLSSVFAGDTLLAFCTAYYLIMASKRGLSETRRLVHSLIRLTFQTAAPAAICAMFNLIFSQIYSGNDKLVSAAFNAALPKLYAVSMMWTLNARRSIRLGSSNGNLSTGSAEVTAPSRRRRNDIELGRLGTIQVRTQIETEHHIDNPVAPPVYYEGKRDSQLRSDEESTDAKSYKAMAV